MTAEERAALVERVADIISMVFEGQGITETAEGVIDLIRAEVLEEAARVAEDSAIALGQTHAPIYIAAAIRAIKNRA